MDNITLDNLRELIDNYFRTEDTEVKDKIFNLVKTIKVDDLGEKLFDQLVPQSGIADTKAGELVRVINKVVYRYYNDGDEFYDEYELNDPFLTLLIAYVYDNTTTAIQGIITKAFNQSINYKFFINILLSLVASFLRGNPNLFITRNTENPLNDSKYLDLAKKLFLDKLELERGED